MFKTENKNGLGIFYGDTEIMSDICLDANICGNTYHGGIAKIEKTENQEIISYKFTEENYFVKLILNITDEGLRFDIDAELDLVYLMQSFPVFDADKAITISFKTDLSEGFAARYMETRWWSYIDFDNIPPKTHSLLLKRVDKNICFAPQCADNAAMSVKSQIYGYNNVLKIMNTYNDVNLIGAFNTSKDKQKCTVVFEDLKDKTNTEFVAYLYFTKKFVMFNKESELSFDLAADDCEIINFYPVKNGKIMLGDTSKYISCGFSTKETNIKDLIF